MNEVSALSPQLLCGSLTCVCCCFPGKLKSLRVRGGEEVGGAHVKGHRRCPLCTLRSCSL